MSEGGRRLGAKITRPMVRESRCRLSCRSRRTLNLSPRNATLSAVEVLAEYIYDKLAGMRVVILIWSHDGFFSFLEMR